MSRRPTPPDVLRLCHRYARGAYVISCSKAADVRCAVAFRRSNHETTMGLIDCLARIASQSQATPFPGLDDGYAYPSRTSSCVLVIVSSWGMCSTHCPFGTPQASAT